ncbi:hypothetical protein MAPG_03395, partial [Magnaporthiopsis poae ATCC 64411]
AGKAGNETTRAKKRRKRTLQQRIDYPCFLFLSPNSFWRCFLLFDLPLVFPNLLPFFFFCHAPSIWMARQDVSVGCFCSPRAPRLKKEKEISAQEAGTQKPPSSNGCREKLTDGNRTGAHAEPALCPDGKPEGLRRAYMGCVVRLGREIIAELVRGVEDSTILLFLLFLSFSFSLSLTLRSRVRHLLSLALNTRDYRTSQRRPTS